MNWSDLFEQENKKEYMQKLKNFLENEYADSSKTIYPPKEDIFNAFKNTPLDKVKCVIIGQDPYHGPNQAMGMSFSVRKSVPIPKSLKNIFVEIQNEYGYDIPTNGDLTPWSKQGVLLLNSVLTVREHEPGSHRGIGWEAFTDSVIKLIETKDVPVVYMLWGNYAKSKQELITNKNHLVLTATHPSPFSAHKGFFGCGHFAKCNEFLKENKIEEINWKI